MRLLSLILVMSFVGLFLLGIDPYIGGFLAFGIIGGLLIELLIRQRDLEYKIGRLTTTRKAVRTAVDTYLKEKNM